MGLPGLTRALADKRYTQKAKGGGYRTDLNVYGLTDRSFARVRDAVRQMRAGTGDLHIVNQGDSISNANTLTSPYTNHYVVQASKILAQKYGVGYRQGLRIPFNTLNSVTDPSVVAGTGWATSGSKALHGTFAVSAAAGATGTVDFTPEVNCDSFNIYWFNGGSSGNVQWAVDGGSYTTLTNPGNGGTYGTFAYVKTNVSAGTLGAHVLHLKSAASGNAAFVMGVEAVDSTSRGVRWFTSGVNGKQSSDLAAAIVPASGESAIAAMNTDLFLIGIGINDFQQATSTVIPTATFQANLTTIITNMRASTSVPDMLLVGFPPPSNTSFTPTMQQYQDAYDAVSDATGVPVLHLDRRWGSFATVNTAPYGYNNDLIHPGITGHAEIGAAIANLILAAAG